MNHDIPVILTDEELHWYTCSVYRSIQQKKRRETYELWVNLLLPGEILVAECSFFGTRRKETKIIAGFPDYNELLDRHDNRFDPLIRIRFHVVPDESIERLAS